MQPMHTGNPVARSPDALARPASNNMPLSEHDTQELRRLLYLRAEGIEGQERLQYLRQTWKSSIWSEEDDDSYTLPDPVIPLVSSLHYGQQCSPEWDDGSVPAETADWQKRKEHGKSNLHAEEDFLHKIEILNLDPRLKKLLLTYEDVFGALPPPLSCKILVQMDLRLKPEFEKTRVRRRPYPAPHEWIEEIERQIQECIDAGLVEEYKKGDYLHHYIPCFLVAKPGSTAVRLVVDYGEVNKNSKNFFLARRAPVVVPHAPFYSPCTFPSSPCPTLDAFASLSLQVDRTRRPDQDTATTKACQSRHCHQRGVTCKAVNQTWSCCLQVCECACVG